MLLIIFILISIVNGDNSCKIDKVEIPILPSRIILTFECYSGTDYNPVIPIDNGSHSSEYNELDLSPNLFVSLPVTQLCPFVNIYLLDLSRNQIKTLRYAFKSLSCLVSLKRFDLSFNLIESPLLDSDFSDEFAQHIEYLNLKNNQIPSIETRVFFRSDGTSRFPSLYYLDLSNNQLKILDLLWPMTLRHPSAKIILSSNKISTITNQLRLSYDHKVFIDVTGDRVVDVSNNELKNLDDSNLLQYNLHSERDFERFLNKLSNYDFSNNRFSCLCPNRTGLFTVHWFKSIASKIVDFSPPIYQVYCAQTFQDNNVFDFECHFKEDQPRPPSQSIEQFWSLFKNNTPKTHTRNTSLILNNLKHSTLTKVPFIPRYWFLFLLLIPFIMLSVLLFVCCFGRYLLVGFHRKFSVNLCACLRNDEDEAYSTSVGKLYDSLILYTSNDQSYLEEKFMPSFALFNKGYKVIKLPIDSNFLMSKGHQECVRACKRIVILISQNFIIKEWNNQILRNSIREVVKNDPFCRVLLINTDDVPYLKVDQFIDELQSTSKEDLWRLPSRFSRLKRKLTNNIKYNCSLKEIETLDWLDTDFWAKFAYTMPMVKNPDRPTEIIQYSQKLADSIFQTSSLMVTNCFYLDYNHVKKKEEAKQCNSNTTVEPLNKKQLPLVTKFKSTPTSHRMCAKMFQAEEQTDVINTDFVEKDDFWTKFESFQKEKNLEGKKKILIPEEIVNKLIGGLSKPESNSGFNSVLSTRSTDTNLIDKILAPVRENLITSPIKSTTSPDLSDEKSSKSEKRKYKRSKNKVKISEPTNDLKDVLK